jgi:trimethylamine--corrinoid protein Co-methyltransferase
MRLQTLKMLSDEEVNQVHKASLEILAEVGVRISNAEAQSALAAGGAEVDRDKHLVKIPPDLVERCVASAPSRFALCSRDGEPTLRLGEGKTYAASGHGGVYVYE